MILLVNIHPIVAANSYTESFCFQDKEKAEEFMAENLDKLNSLEESCTGLLLCHKDKAAFLSKQIINSSIITFEIQEDKSEIDFNNDFREDLRISNDTERT